eukprot:gb/GECG01002656.1/.p1 GENE.gb/GECG01002656.1/~~gb/GECG01002656.1/.p1  ORF type:complete len:171 (+),score=26.34 gb/GECG01002656.1/:1-513(+)
MELQQLVETLESCLPRWRRAVQGHRDDNNAYLTPRIDANALQMRNPFEDDVGTHSSGHERRHPYMPLDEVIQECKRCIDYPQEEKAVGQSEQQKQRIKKDICHGLVHTMQRLVQALGKLLRDCDRRRQATSSQPAVSDDECQSILNELDNMRMAAKVALNNIDGVDHANA